MLLFKVHTVVNCNQLGIFIDEQLHIYLKQISF